MILVWDNGQGWSLREIHFFKLDGGYDEASASAVLKAHDAEGEVLFVAEAIEWRAIEPESFVEWLSDVFPRNETIMGMVPFASLGSVRATYVEWLGNALKWPGHEFVGHYRDMIAVIDKRLGDGK